MVFWQYSIYTLLPILHIAKTLLFIIMTVIMKTSSTNFKIKVKLT